MKTLVVGATLPGARELSDQLGVPDAYVSSPRSCGARGLSGVQRVFVDRAVMTEDMLAELAPLVAFTGGQMFAVSRIL
ncbi:hypothetical protein KXD96_27960 (plasmid) [Mycobacterium sp. SMC-2]|uniref:hypothetical protein n=1 Tax=Mycobacterium sp. SMC-2 TaxID=2857058 RepID=UPI0021B1C5FF|nr:hypothetical protein [Mycobacterium sp. SMC-2]UXA06578.1 hypothetical protein KXD96_27825 [Mycobacterium sp. SMC-2]UXA09669.1 hypothetical protein KXD96_27960 [Mycobacterium sp. SMC-2]